MYDTYAPELPGTAHVQPENIASWLYHRGFATRADRADAVSQAINAGVTFVHGDTEYTLRYHTVGEYGQYHAAYRAI